MLRVGVVERRRQRLDERHRSVVRARIAPRLERVRGRHVPVRELGRLVKVERVVHDHPDLREPFGELEIGGRGEDGVDAEDHEELHLPGGHRGRELRERRVPVHRLRFDGRTVGHGRVHVAERLVHRMRERVHGRGLILTGDDHRPAAMSLEILCDGRDPLLDELTARGRRRDRARRRAGADRGGETPREPFDLRSLERQAMFRLRARQRRRAFDDVQAVHVLVVVGDAPPIGEVPGVAQRSDRGRREEVRLEGQDDVRFVEVIDRVRRRSVRLADAGSRAVAADGIVLVPLRGRILLQRRRQQLRERRRRDGLTEDSETRSLDRLLCPERGLDRAHAGGPRAYFTAMGQRLRAIGIVEAEHGRLRDGVGGAEARGMIGVAFDLRRPAHVAFDQHGPGNPRDRNGAREEEGPSGDEIFGLTDVRDDLLGGLPRAGADPRERERRAHQLEEVSAAFRIVPLGRLRRKLAVQVIAEVLAVGQLAQASPIEPAFGARETGSD